MKYYQYKGYDQSWPKKINEVQYNKLSYFARQNYREIEETIDSNSSTSSTDTTFFATDLFFNSSMDNSNPIENTPLDDFNGFGGGDFGGAGAGEEY